MAQPGIALAFSGAIGSVKSSVSGELQNLLKWPRVSFGDFVRKKAAEMGRDPTDRTVLQKLGQALVVSDLQGFVRDVLAQAPDWADADGIDQHLWSVAGLVVGGVIAAPLAGFVVRVLPANRLMLMVGTLVVLLACFQAWELLFKAA